MDNLNKGNAQKHGSTVNSLGGFDDYVDIRRPFIEPTSSAPN